jgi:photosystem II stability/assembly factor-like uncharacterized protein
MPENNELTQDEQMHPELTKQLQESYVINQADQQSLQRIRARIQQTHGLSIQRNSYQENIYAGQFAHPPVPVQQRTNQGRWRIGVLAALLLIALLAGTFIALRFNPLPIIGTPSREKPKNTPILPIKTQKTSLIQITMKSETNGWGEAMAAATDGNFPQHVLVHTIDGGKSWSEVQLPAPYTSFITPFFLNETTAWVIPGSGAGFDTSDTPLIRTTDGGKSWQKFMIPGGTSEITFVDKQNGWAMDVKQKGQDVMDQNLAIFHTTDGGKTWQQMSKAQAGTTNITPGPFPSGEFGGGTFLNPQKGWFVTGSMTIAGHGSAYKGLYITLDGGKSWQLQQLPQSGEIIPAPNTDTGSKVIVAISLPRFFDTQHGNLFVYVNDQQKIHIYIYSTGDGGQTWQLVGNKLSKDVSKDAGNYSLATLIDATHFMLTDKNVVDVYGLAGGQWQKNRVTIKGVNSYNETVDFINGQTGWFVGRKDVVVDKKTNDKTYTSVIYKTDDGGKSWQEIQQGSYVVSGNAPQG